MSQRRRARASRARPGRHEQAPPEPLPDRGVALIGGAIVTVAAFALYLATAARDIVFGDTPELTTAAITLGVPHPPGYPLWTMLGWLFAQLPIDGPAFRVALLSVVCQI